MAATRSRRDSKPRVAPAIAGRNRILSGLLAGEYEHLLPRLEHVELAAGEVVYRADQRIDQVYFPAGAVVAMVHTTGTGRTVEVGVIGREGLVGITVFLGGVATADKAIVQLPGAAMRMKARDLRREMHFGSPLQRLLLDYTRTLLGVMSQSVACSRHHGIDERVARWLLTMSDHANGREFFMVHASIAAMLGVRRVSVTEAAGRLQAAKLINYRRGRISVLDRQALGERCCECYLIIREQYEALHAGLPKLLQPG